jgi:hypothetical protein
MGADVAGGVELAADAIERNVVAGDLDAVWRAFPDIAERRRCVPVFLIGHVFL